MINHNAGRQEGGIYEIRVAGALDAHWSHWFQGVTVTPAGDETILAGPIADGAALYGVISRLRDLGLILIAVTRLTGERGA